MGKSREIARLPNAPAFSAYATIATAVATATLTKVTLGFEVFDTNSNFASSRFTPTVAGYYQINGSVKFSGSTTNPACYVTKNGTQAVSSNYLPGSFTSPVVTVGGLIYLNGSTDYIELAAYHTTGASVDVTFGQDVTRFDGCLIRAA